MKTKAKATPRTPQQARTFKQICELPRDNISTGKSWMMIDVGEVIIVNQRRGEATTGRVTLTHAEFEKFARWYTTGKLR